MTPLQTVNVRPNDGIMDTTSDAVDEADVRYCAFDDLVTWSSGQYHIR